MQVTINLPDNTVDEIIRQVKVSLIDELKPQPVPAKEWMNKTEASKYLGISRVTLNALIKDKHIPMVQANENSRTYLISKTALDNYLQDYTD